MRDLCLSPELGTCCFGAGLQGWGFTVPQFSKFYAKKFPGSSYEQWNKNLWGNHFFNKKKNVWTTK